MSVVGDERRRQLDARQVAAVLARRGHRRTPARHRAPTGARRVRCAPGARPAPCPSCPIRSRRCGASCPCPPSAALGTRAQSDTARMLPRCRNRIRTATIVAPMSTARRPGVSHSTIGSTIVATIDPSETNRVRATMTHECRGGDQRRHGVEHAEHAARGGHAFAAAEAAATPDRCGRPRPPRLRRPHSLRRRRATPRPRPSPCRPSSRRSPVDSPAVRYTLVAPTLPLPTRRRSIAAGTLCATR